MITKIKKTLRSKEFKDFFLYFIVGGLATIVEWAVFWILTNNSNIHYLWATSLAFVFSTFANWAFGRLLVFKLSNGSLWREISSIYLASLVGLVLNLVIMLILVQAFTIDEMPSKVAATALVFIYNYLIRKLVIYKKSDGQTDAEQKQKDLFITEEEFSRKNS